MKLRLLAMATVAAAALSTPALAGEGWYLGFGGGYDAQSSVKFTSLPVPASNTKAGSDGSGIGAISLGYAFGGGWRLEDEIAFTGHSPNIAGSTAYDSITSDLFNILYDIPLGSHWKI